MKNYNRFIYLANTIFLVLGFGKKKLVRLGSQAKEAYSLRLPQTHCSIISAVKKYTNEDVCKMKIYTK